jgi:hypothetical protein
MNSIYAPCPDHWYWRFALQWKIHRKGPWTQNSLSCLRKSPLNGRVTYGWTINTSTSMNSSPRSRPSVYRIEALVVNGIGQSWDDMRRNTMVDVNRLTFCKAPCSLQLFGLHLTLLFAIFRLGPLSVEKKVRKQVRQARLTKNKEDLVQPSKVKSRSKGRQEDLWLTVLYTDVAQGRRRTTANQWNLCQCQWYL